MKKPKKSAKEAKAASMQRRMDRLAVKIVTIVSEKMSGGKLYAYSGIEAAREVRALLLRTVARL